jgi:hypothetical protein
VICRAPHRPRWKPLSHRLDWHNAVAAGSGSKLRVVFTRGLAIVTGLRSGRNDETRYPILDALRFLFTSRVVMDHYSKFRLFANADTSVSAIWLRSHSYATILWGAPAVMGFLSFRVFAFIFYSEMGRPYLSRDSTVDATFELISAKNA